MRTITTIIIIYSPTSLAAGKLSSSEEAKERMESISGRCKVRILRKNKLIFEKLK